MISFNQARAIVASLEPLDAEEVDIANAIGRVLSEDVRCLVDAPPKDSSLKDGFALKAADISCASPDSPVSLSILGTLYAGQEGDLTIKHGQAAQIMTGAGIPKGADAVLPQELTTTQKGQKNKVFCLGSTSCGRNILKKGADLKKGEVLLAKGTVLTPNLIGLLTGGGICRVSVIRSPSVAIVATGSELTEDGRVDECDKIFPSNRATIGAWLKVIGVDSKAMLCRDDPKALREMLAHCLERFDVVITSGGVLDGKKDLVVSTFQELGVDFLFRRVRMGPGKGVCMGTKDRTLVFNLPGGPPSNFVAFIFIALFAIIRLMGNSDAFPTFIKATLTCSLKGRADWTQLLLSQTRFKGSGFFTVPVFEESRLKRIANANSIIIIPEGKSHVKAGHEVEVALLPKSF